MDAIAAVNRKNKTGKRKCGFLVNDGDKLTKEDKENLKKENQEKYGLKPEFVAALKVPPSTSVQIYDVNKILNPRSRLSTIEKINHLLELRQALKDKLEHLRTVKEKAKAEKQAGSNKVAEKTSSIEEDEQEVQKN